MKKSKVLEALDNFSRLLVNQKKARIIIPAQKQGSGFWFGGGNMIEYNGALYVSGRYRNFGDSRTGLGMGERGLEMAVFKSADRGGSWKKVVSFSKSDLNLPGRKVLSIEGTAIHPTNSGVELFISTEKQGRNYPEGLEDFQKPGTGIWSIDRVEAPVPEDLTTRGLSEVLSCADPQYIHVKDPFVYSKDNGDMVLGFCTHPFNWTSSNTGYMVRNSRNDTWSTPVYNHFPRGTTWDAGMSRGTAVIDVPKIGIFTDEIKMSLLFYDGGESVRNLDEHREGVRRPRGYSCEELGGAAYLLNESFNGIERLSRYLPHFVSPKGNGTSRYVDVLRANDGFYCTWQQSQDDFSQPLVMNFVSHEETAGVLGG